jgi:hypothetical protein
MDNLRQARCAGALCANDAKSCYDRVVHSIVALAMRCMGVPVNPMKSMFSTLQKASHKIRTAFGVSDKTYAAGLWSREWMWTLRMGGYQYPTDQLG